MVKSSNEILNHVKVHHSWTAINSLQLSTEAEKGYLTQGRIFIECVCTFLCPSVRSLFPVVRARFFTVKVLRQNCNQLGIRKNQERIFRNNDRKGNVYMIIPSLPST